MGLCSKQILVIYFVHKSGGNFQSSYFIDGSWKYETQTEVCAAEGNERIRVDSVYTSKVESRK